VSAGAAYAASGANGTNGDAMPMAQAALSRSTVDEDTLKLHLGADEDMSSAFDVPAFLRRQEG
jgi:hypothetical protein